MQTQGGGNCANALTAAARLGLAPTIVTKIGGDGVGDSILAELERDGVDTSHVLRAANAPSPFTYIIVDRLGAAIDLHAPRYRNVQAAPACCSQSTTQVAAWRRGLAVAALQPHACRCSAWCVMLVHMNHSAAMCMCSSRLRGHAQPSCRAPRSRPLYSRSMRPPAPRGAQVHACAVPGGTRTCIHTPGEALDPAELALPCSRVRSALAGAALTYFDGRLAEAAGLLASGARERGVPILVEGERLRPGLDALLAAADYVTTSAQFPQARALAAWRAACGRAPGGCERWPLALLCRPLLYVARLRTVRRPSCGIRKSPRACLSSTVAKNAKIIATSTLSPCQPTAAAW